MTRIVKNVVRRSDDHSIDTLHSIATVQRVLDDTTIELVRHLRTAAGGAHSWSQIGEVLGISRQAAQMKFGGEGARKPGGQPAELR